MSYNAANPAPSHQRALVKSPRTKGRPPTVYRPELAAAICERVAEGETLTTVCKSDGMPSATSFRRWVLAHKELFEAFQSARQLSADAMFDEALDMARTLADEPGTAQRVRAYDVAMSQLRWSAGKLHPQQYSDRSQVAFVVPIQIVTSLNLGQEGVEKVTDSSIYELKAEVVMPGERADDEGEQATKRVQGQRVKKKERGHGS